jgi:hypothetical protein
MIVVGLCLTASRHCSRRSRRVIAALLHRSASLITSLTAARHCGISFTSAPSVFWGERRWLERPLSARPGSINNNVVVDIHHVAVDCHYNHIFIVCICVLSVGRDASQNKLSANNEFDSMADDSGASLLSGTMPDALRRAGGSSSSESGNEV